MATNNISIPVSKVSQNIVMNVRVTGLRVWRIRWWMASHLFKIAARVAGCGISVSVENEGRPSA